MAIKLGIVGLGTVGSGVVRLIQQHAQDYQRDLSCELEIHKVYARTLSKAEALGLAHLQAQSIDELVSDPQIDVVLELIGGTDDAYTLVKSALYAGKSVVSANKALLAAHGDELFALAADKGVALKFEAAVAGGIPIVGALLHSLRANKICTIAGIMNGTTNYILTRMAQEGLSFEEVLKDAQDLGYAEADPSADIDGFDAAHKIALLARVGFHSPIDMSQLSVEGIRSVSARDIEYAQSMGYAVKLLAIARRTPQGLDVRVHPTMIENSHPLARVDGVYNAVYVIGDAVQETMFLGPGAGSFPTASAVMGDVLELASAYERARAQQVLATAPLNVNMDSLSLSEKLPMRNILEIHTKYYVRLGVEDEPGVLAATAQVFGEHSISIESMVQRKPSEGMAELVYVTHRAAERDMKEALGRIEKLPSVRELATLIRVEDTETWKKDLLK